MTASREFPPLPTQSQLKKLYPTDLELVNVQILFRHGERTPVRARFQTWGLQPFWPFCKIARHFTQTVVTYPNENTSTFEYVRRLESVAKNLPYNVPVPASGFKSGEHDDLCMLGELTDLGRETGFKLGDRLRWLYVDQLKFLPTMFMDHDNFYFRSSHVARSNETLMSLFNGLYPPMYRKGGLLPIIYTRLFPQENAYPNDENCRRLSELGYMFSEIAAQRWNPILADYPSKKLKDVLPDGVAIDGSPRASGVFDTWSACVAHGVALPEGFSDKRVTEELRAAVMDEWYLGVQQSREYRTLAVGALVGDFLHRMKLAVTDDHKDHVRKHFFTFPEDTKESKKEKAVKLALYGSHDTTIASVLHALNAFDNLWPPFTTDLRFELFAKSGRLNPDMPDAATKPPSVLDSASSSESELNLTPIVPAVPKREYFVRLTYNDKVLQLPGCAKAGDHLAGDKSLCTMAAFENVVNEFLPMNWEKQCRQNLGKQVLDNPVIAKEYAAIRTYGREMAKVQA
ncbi:histidine phosphatase superfamily [Lipomyces arxii]|uniref:histidine phosphatase superfamily n=1 Tax=Lipomyces arxii TaxID=56418 RepID=UPI0034CF26EA